MCGRQSSFQLLPYGFALDSQGGGGEVIWAMFCWFSLIQNGGDDGGDLDGDDGDDVLGVDDRWVARCSLCEGASLALLNARPSAQPSMKLKMMMLAAIMMRRIIHDCIGFLWFYNSHKNLITFRPKMAKKKAITF